MITVTQPFLPNQEKYIAYLKQIWERKWLTNHGPLVNELELKLKDYLDISHCLYLSNGTIALQIAIKAFQLKGEIITTPFSYVATTSSIIWEGCEPIFVDIDSATFNIDPIKIEKAISEKTSAILATHVFGNPCDIKAIEAIANKHKLKVIYDAAHCFGTQYKNKTIFSYGDISTTSFHATKIFHTIEGGAVFCQHPELLRKMSLLRNFGHVSPTDFEGIGINGKNSEFHAAMGLCILPEMKRVLDKRKNQCEYYDYTLKNLDVTRQEIQYGTNYNYAYYPVVFQSEEILLKTIKLLNTYHIFPRRYFYPSLDTLKYTNQNNCPISKDISARILCLPLYDNLTKEDQHFIARLMLRVQNN